MRELSFESYSFTPNFALALAEADCTQNSESRKGDREQLNMGGIMLVLAAALLSPIFAEMTWRLCDQITRPMSPTQVTLTPDPPIIGGSATFNVQSESGGIA